MMRHMRNNYIEHRTSLYYYIPEFSMEFSNRRVSNRRVVMVITQRQHDNGLLSMRVSLPCPYLSPSRHHARHPSCRLRRPFLLL